MRGKTRQVHVKITDAEHDGTMILAIQEKNDNKKIISIQKKIILRGIERAVDEEFYLPTFKRLAELEETKEYKKFKENFFLTVETQNKVDVVKYLARAFECFRSTDPNIVAIGCFDLKIKDNPYTWKEIYKAVSDKYRDP